MNAQSASRIRLALHSKPALLAPWACAACFGSAACIAEGSALGPGAALCAGYGYIFAATAIKIAAALLRAAESGQAGQAFLALTRNFDLRFGAAMCALFACILASMAAAGQAPALPAFEILLLPAGFACGRFCASPAAAPLEAEFLASSETARAQRLSLRESKSLSSAAGAAPGNSKRRGL